MADWIRTRKGDRGAWTSWHIPQTDSVYWCGRKRLHDGRRIASLKQEEIPDGRYCKWCSQFRTQQVLKFA